MKVKYNVPCVSCDSINWQVIHKEVGFLGDEKITFECLNCGYTVVVLRYELKGEKKKVKARIEYYFLIAVYFILEFIIRVRNAVYFLYTKFKETILSLKARKK